MNADRFPADLLETWKAAREGDTASELSSLSNLTEAVLSQMIESAVSALGPRREVKIEVTGGVLYPAGELASLPIGRWRDVRQLNPSMAPADLVVIVTVRNTGHLVVHIEAVEIHYVLDWKNKPAEISLAGRNDFPLLNPLLPRPLDIGESAHWLTRLETFAMIVSQMKATPSSGLEVVQEFYATVRLGSGETIRSERFKLSELPLEKT